MQVYATDDLEAQRRLEKIGLRLGDWHRMGYLREPDNYQWRNVIAPRDATTLLSFSQRAIEWLPIASQYIAAFDDSTVIDDAQTIMFENILGISIKSAARSGVLLINASSSSFELRINLSLFGYLCLLFGLHVYIAAGDVDEGPLLGFIDETAYFISRGSDGLQKFVPNILQDAAGGAPDWVANNKP